MASMRSHMIETRYRGSAPWLAISSRFQPAPTPTTTLPSDSWSRVEICLATTIGSWSGSTSVPIPSVIVRVAVAMQARLTMQSWKCRNSSGTSPAGRCEPGRSTQVLAEGNGVRRLTGIWECSPSQIESKPISSTICPSRTGDTAKSAGIMVMPKFTGAPRPAGRRRGGRGRARRQGSPPHDDRAPGRRRPERSAARPSRRSVAGDTPADDGLGVGQPTAIRM